MRLSFALASRVCAFVCSLLVEQVSASFQGKEAQVDPRDNGAIESKSNMDDLSFFRFARFRSSPEYS